jgi:hypothetical protein
VTAHVRLDTAAAKSAALPAASSDASSGRMSMPLVRISPRPREVAQAYCPVGASVPSLIDCRLRSERAICCRE